jgi:hypothetical protein
MFAVVILGIGFILIAAIFPVAIQQSQATAEESSAAAIAREAANAIAAFPSTMANPNVPPTGYPIVSPSQTIQTLLLYPPTVKNYALGSINSPPTPFGPGLQSVAPPAIVVPFSGAQYEALKGNAILPSDPRYAWAAFYKRENSSSVMQLIVVAMTTRAKPIYDPSADATASYTTPSLTTVRQFVAASTGKTVICNDELILGSGGGGNYEGYTASPTVTLSNAYSAGYPAGRYYRLGRNVGIPGGPMYEIDPGNNLSLTPGTGGLWGVAGGTADTLVVSSPATLAAPTNLQATIAYAQINAVPDRTGGRIKLVTSPTNPAPPPAAGTGAFVIVADDYPFDPTNPFLLSYSLPPNSLLPQPPPAAPPSLPTTYTVGALNGRIFRLGTPVSEDLEIIDPSTGKPTQYPPGVFDLDPQYGMRPPRTTPGYFPESPDTMPADYLLQFNPGSASLYAKVYIVGIGKDGQGNYAKNAQDIGVYATYVPVQ